MKNNEIRLAGVAPQSLVNGPGLRKVYFSQGCKHHCFNCFNPETWSFTSGKVFNMDELLKETTDQTYLDGITFSGGDPFEQAEKFAYMAKRLKQQGWNIWAYTGYTWEELLKMSKSSTGIVDLINCLDVIVDGKYIDKLHSHDYKYRGSSNQRLIDVSKSLTTKKTIVFPTK